MILIVLFFGTSIENKISPQKLALILLQSPSILKFSDPEILVEGDKKICDPAPMTFTEIA